MVVVKSLSFAQVLGDEILEFQDFDFLLLLLYFLCNEQRRRLSLVGIVH